MAKEIKFRAWDTIKNIFVDEGEITFYFYGDSYIEVHPNSITYIGDRVHNGEPERGRFTIQQYTGLKDKNGKEIFEGDLLQYDGYNFKLINKEKIYQIKYDDNLAQYYSYNLENSFDTFLVVRAWKESKVIGNIYQNPELLGGEND